MVRAMTLQVSAINIAQAIPMCPKLGASSAAAIKFIPIAPIVILPTTFSIPKGSIHYMIKALLIALIGKTRANT